MSNKKINENPEKCEDVEICENEHENTTMVSEDVINTKGSITIKKNDDGNLYTEDRKKYKNETTVDIGAYLRSEFTDVIDQDINGKHDIPSTLPEYKKVAIVGNKSKKHSRKKPKVYSEDTVFVQFMGSEILPENKVQMLYEPESRNFTVKTMFAMLLMMHLFITLGLIYMGASPFHDVMLWFRWYGHYLLGFALLISVILMMCMICLESMRIGWRSSVGVFGTLFAFVAIGSAFPYLWVFSGFKLFLNISATMFWVDIICIIVGCTKFDYTSKLMYVIVVVPGLAIYTLMVFGLGNGLSSIYWNVEDRIFPNDVTISTVFILILLPVTVSELHILLDNETIELAEDDYFFGAYLLLICLVDCPIRHLRKRGLLGNTGGGDEEEDEE